LLALKFGKNTSQTSADIDRSGVTPSALDSSQPLRDKMPGSDDSNCATANQLTPADSGNTSNNNYVGAQGHERLDTAVVGDYEE